MTQFYQVSTTNSTARQYKLNTDNDTRVLNMVTKNDQFIINVFK